MHKIKQMEHKMQPELEKKITKDDLIDKGNTTLTKEELYKLIANTTVSGDYEYNGHRRYKTFMNANGEMEAKNDWGSHIFGHYTIDDNGLFSVTWDGYWDEWTGVAFKTHKEIRFYNIVDGRWMTTFTDIKLGKQNLDVK